MRLFFLFVLSLFFLSSVYGMGLGVTPETVIFQEGEAELIITNPNEYPIRLSVRSNKNNNYLVFSPEEMSIAPGTFQIVHIEEQGKGERPSYVFIEGKGGMIAPSLAVKVIFEEDKKAVSLSSLWMFFLLGMFLAVLIFFIMKEI